jgi:Xaa-Pro aminopeptidase
MNRIEKFLLELTNSGLDGFFTSSVSNITYLTGFTGDSSRLFVSSGKCVLMTDGRYTEQAGQECSSEVEVLKWIEDKRYAAETYKLVISAPSIKRIGFEGSLLTFNEYNTFKTALPDKELISTNGLIEKLRQIKDDTELKYLQTASAISDKALENTIPYIKAGITELELTARLEYNLKINGAENLSFDSLILSGARTSLLHGKPSEKKIQPGDLVLFDFGALYKGYHADISRTFVVGKTSELQKEVYEIIRKAQANAIKSLKPGISSHVPDEAVREVIPEEYIEFYYPGLGHGVGLQIHEEPFLGKNYQYTLDQNMTITIEPGIYIPGWGGIRIEDTVAITSEDAVSFNNFPRELREL